MPEFNQLDPLIHSQLRLSIMSLAMANKRIEFMYIKEKTGATNGNISVQLDKLANAGYLKITKKFRNKKPVTSCQITPVGIEAFEKYITDLENYLKPK